MTQSYLYVIGPDDPIARTEWVKIGRSAVPTSRRSQLQVGQGARLKVFGAFKVSAKDAVRLEAAAHSALASVRIKGEVFQCEPELACAFVEHIALHGEADDFLRLALARAEAQRRWTDLATRPSAGGRWAKPHAVAAAEEAEAEADRLDDAFYAMDRARADKIDPRRLWLEKLG